MRPCLLLLALPAVLALARPARGADAGAPALTRPPAPLAPPALAHPPGSEAASATVGLLVDLDAEGRVLRAEVVEPAGGGFDEAAVAAVTAMRFSPAEIDGRPAAIRFRYRLHFRARAIADGGASDADAHAGASDASADAAPAPARLVLRGHARERGTRRPIAGAEILVLADPPAPGETATVTGETDAAGAFEVWARPGARGLRITVADPEHEPCIRVLDPAALAAPTTPIVAEPWTCQLTRRVGPRYETVVTAAPAAPQETRHAITKAEARSVPGTMGDPLRAVQSLPGVARAPYGLGTLVVRGALPNNSAVFLDGLQVPVLYHFLVGPSIVPAALVDEIDFYPGGFGVRYGRLSAGAVEVSTPRLVPQTTEGNAEISPLDASLLVTTPLSPSTALTLAGRRSLIDLILPALVPSEPGTSFTTLVPRYWDYQARLLHQSAGGDQLRVLLFGSSDDLEVVSANPNQRFEFGNQISFARLHLSWTTRAGGYVSRLEPALGIGTERFKGGADNGEIRYRRFYLRETLERDLGPRLAVGLGLDLILSRDEADFDIVFPREGRSFGYATPERTRTHRRLNNFGPSTFLEARWRPTDWLRVVPGVRLDPYYVFSQWRTSADPRVAVHYQLSPRLDVRAGAGLYHQLPEPRYLDPEFGNPALRMVRSEQYYVGADRPITDAFRVSATLFALWRRFIPVPSAERMASIGRARARGIELMLRHKLTRHFYGWLAYTLSRAEQTTDFAEEIETGAAQRTSVPQDEAAAGRYRRATFDQTHNLVVVASYRRWAWEAGARYRLVTGRPTSAVVSAFNDLDYNGFTPVRGAPFSTRRPAFSQLDLRVERLFTFDLYRLGVFLDVQNVLNAENPEEILYDYRYAKSAPVRGLPILPLLGLRGSF